MERPGVTILTVMAIVAVVTSSYAETWRSEDYGVSITIPDTWKIKQTMPLGIIFERRDDPEHFYGRFLIAPAYPGETARSIIADQRASRIQGGDSCSEMYEDMEIAGVTAAHYYYYYISPDDGREMIKGDFLAVKGDIKVWLTIDGPNASWQAEPGLFNEVTSITDSINVW